jgi:hypothetical protein
MNGERISMRVLNMKIREERIKERNWEQQVRKDVKQKERRTWEGGGLGREIKMERLGC